MQHLSARAAPHSKTVSKKKQNKNKCRFWNTKRKKKQNQFQNRNRFKPVLAVSIFFQNYSSSVFLKHSDLFWKRRKKQSFLGTDCTHLLWAPLFCFLFQQSRLLFFLFVCIIYWSHFFFLTFIFLVKSSYVCFSQNKISKVCKINHFWTHKQPNFTESSFFPDKCQLAKLFQKTKFLNSRVGKVKP